MFLFYSVYYLNIHMHAKLAHVSNIIFQDRKVIFRDNTKYSQARNVTLREMYK